MTFPRALHQLAGIALAIVLSAAIRAQTLEVVTAATGSSVPAGGGLPALSADGRYVAFESSASNLVSGDTNNSGDIFVRDRITGATVRVSVSSTGVQASGDCSRCSISGTGRYVLFMSPAANLVSGVSVYRLHVYRHDRDRDSDGVFDEPGGIEPVLVDADNGGTPANDHSRCVQGALSADGNMAVFESHATNLVGSNSNGSILDCFARNLAAGTTTLISITAAGVQANGVTYAPVISADGIVVAFNVGYSTTNLFPGDSNSANDVVTKNRGTGAITLISRSSSGTIGNAGSIDPTVSANGRWVSFESAASNFGSGGGSSAVQIYLRDTVSGTTTLVSRSPAGAPANAHCTGARISSDGTVIAFASSADSLFPGDLNCTQDVFAVRPATGAVSCLSRNLAGEFADSYSGGGSGPWFQISISANGGEVAFGSGASNLVPGDVNGAWDLFVRGDPFASLTAPPPLPPLADPGTNPATISVRGPVSPNSAGLAAPRGAGSSIPFGTRTPAVPAAFGIPTLRPGDVKDYFLGLVPSVADLFQSEPDPFDAAPAGTNNQILVAATCGLVAGTPAAPFHVEIDGLSFGDDHFGVSAVSTPTTLPTAVPWSARAGTFVSPTVTGDRGTSFRLSVDAWAIGGPATVLRVESGGGDLGSGLGPWTSPGAAAGDIFATPVLTAGFPPSTGINMLYRDNLELGLAPSFGVLAMEDDIDALECVDVRTPRCSPPPFAGNLHVRTVPLEPAHTVLGELAGPGLANHDIPSVSSGFAPVYFSVSRASTGEALSAVRTQSILGEQAGDVFMALGGTNLLLIDEEEAGLYGGFAGIIPSDDLDALILLVHPDDRVVLEFVASTVLGAGVMLDPDGIPGSGDEYMIGPGYSTSLLRHAPLMGFELRIKLGFSVTSDSIGLRSTAVDFEAGLDPSGHAQQAGDVYFTHFGFWPDVAGPTNSAPTLTLGMNWLWYEEADLGLDPGAWVSGSSTNLALLPDELDGLDSTDAPMSCPGSIVAYGTGCPGSGGIVPLLSGNGCPTSGQPLGVAVSGGLGGTAGLLAFGLAPASTPIAGAAGCTLLVAPLLPTFHDLTLSGSGSGAGSYILAVLLPRASSPVTFTMQSFLADPGAANGLVSATNGLAITIL